MDTINKDMKDAEKHLTQLEKCCCFTCPWNKVPPHEDGGAYGISFRKKIKFNIMKFLAQTTYDSNGGVISEAPKSGSTRTFNQTGGYPGQQTQQIQKIAGDEREDEMEQNLGQVLHSFLYILKPYFKVSNILSGLKNMALDMGDTIESQNTQIDRINDKAEQNELRVAAANERSEKILNGKKKK